MQVAPRWRIAPAAMVATLVLGVGVGVAPPADGAQDPDPGAGPAVDDPGLGRQWALATIGAPAAWSVATGAGITIAVVDSGIAVDHPDLAGKIDGVADCVGNDDAPGGCVDGVAFDEAGHGTHVAGIAAAATDNGRGVAGVAPQARLLGVRVLANRCGPGGGGDGCEAEGSERDVADGIRWAADRGADVINLSLGSIAQAAVGPGQAFAEALDHAWSRGAIPVLVAGNDLVLPGSVLDVPAVVVTATDRDDAKATYANGVGNVRWGVAAPGGESDTAETCESESPNGILSTFFRPGEPGFGDGSAGYACVAGTSMAAPHVAGALAVLRSAGLSPEDAVERLLASADDLGAAGDDTTFGAGRINLARAVEGLEPTGQPVRSDQGTPPAGAEITVATTPPGSAAEVAPPTTTPAVAAAPTTPPGEPSSGAVPPATGDAPADQAIGAPGGPSRDDELPAAPVTAAVLAVVAVATGHAWRYLAAARSARRTPRSR